MTTQVEKAHTFRALHARPTPFIIPNPWDAGTARLLAQIGFEALATTSAGHAFSIGRPDNSVTRAQVIAHVATIAAATDLPVSADLENGFGESPDDVAETIRLAAAAGAVGGSIEDMARDQRAVYDPAYAAERVQAAAEAAATLPFPFTLTARAENYLVGRADLEDTIERLQAYAAAGAHVVYAPGLTSREDIAAVVRAVDRPVNVVMGLQGVQLTLQELAALGVRRVSVGSALARAAMGAVLRAGREMRERGTFTFAAEAAGYRAMNAMLARPLADDGAARAGVVHVGGAA